MTEKEYAQVIAKNLKRIAFERDNPHEMMIQTQKMIDLYCMAFRITQK